ncbi:hypothetical protein [Xanthomonas sp. LMG 12462]|uniref:hypothetical protein n=1 Tax=Xanthomonas sp. LMG 12462 TaxID=1591134 RepID=UPI0012651CD9|nr:hypothetical protein [Xanthomonas sp. LMG 12462]
MGESTFVEALEDAAAGAPGPRLNTEHRGAIDGIGEAALGQRIGRACCIAARHGANGDADKGE